MDAVIHWEDQQALTERLHTRPDRWEIVAEHLHADEVNSALMVVETLGNEFEHAVELEDDSVGYYVRARFVGSPGTGENKEG